MQGAGGLGHQWTAVAGAGGPDRAAATVRTPARRMSVVLGFREYIGSVPAKIPHGHACGQIKPAEMKRLCLQGLRAKSMRTQGRTILCPTAAHPTAAHMHAHVKGSPATWRQVLSNGA